MKTKLLNQQILCLLLAFMGYAMQTTAQSLPVNEQNLQGTWELNMHQTPNEMVEQDMKIRYTYGENGQYTYEMENNQVLKMESAAYSNKFFIVLTGRCTGKWRLDNGNIVVNFNDDYQNVLKSFSAERTDRDMDKIIIPNMKGQLEKQDGSGLFMALKELDGKPQIIVSLSANEMVMGSREEGGTTITLKRIK